MRDDDLAELRVWIIVTVVVAIVFFAMLPKWMNGDEERSVLASAGYTQVKLDGFRFLDCPDLFGMGFEAKGPTGQPAKGAVCRGIFAAASIRLTNY